MSELPNYLPGIPPMYGLKQPSPEFSQGTDVVVEFTVTVDGEPLNDPKDWVLEAFIKKSLKANNILWKCTLGYNLYQKEKSNTYFFRLPHQISAQFLPGSYVYAVIGTQKVGTGAPFDRRLTFSEGTFDLTLDAGSPYPRLTGSNVKASFFDAATGKYIYQVESTERTEPNPIDLTLP
jgi:hypothetical protein